MMRVPLLVVMMVVMVIVILRRPCIRPIGAVRSRGRKRPVRLRLQDRQGVRDRLQKIRVRACLQRRMGVDRHGG